MIHPRQNAISIPLNNGSRNTRVTPLHTFLAPPLTDSCETLQSRSVMLRVFVSRLPPPTSFLNHESGVSPVHLFDSLLWARRMKTYTGSNLKAQRRVIGPKIVRALYLSDAESSSDFKSNCGIATTIWYWPCTYDHRRNSNITLAYVYVEFDIILKSIFPFWRAGHSNVCHL